MLDFDRAGAAFKECNPATDVAQHPSVDLARSTPDGLRRSDRARQLAAGQAFERVGGFVQLRCGLARIALNAFDALGDLGQLRGGAPIAGIKAGFERRQLDPRLHHVLLERLDLFGRQFALTQHGHCLRPCDGKGCKRADHAAQRRRQCQARRQKSEPVQSRGRTLASGIWYWLCIGSHL